MKITTIVLLTFFICHEGVSQLNASFDFSNVNETIRFFKKDRPSQADMDSMVNTSGIRIIIKKIYSSDSIARIALYKAATGIQATGKEKDFQFEFIKSNLQHLEDFSTRINNNTNVILDSIQSLAAYLPVGKKLAVKVCFLTGGFSAGFTMGDENVLYIGMHQYKNDLTGIVNVCQHELFHNIQSLLYNRTDVMKKLQVAKELPSLYAYYLLQNIFVEGSAEYVADIDKMETASLFMQEQLAHAAANKYRIADNFYLVETLAMSVYRNPENADVNTAYNILFDWNWNNPGYAVGKIMCKALIKIYGPQILMKYLGEDPTVFIKDYIKISKEDELIFLYRFSNEFEQIIDTVSLKIKYLEKDHP